MPRESTGARILASLVTLSLVHTLVNMLQGVQAVCAGRRWVEEVPTNAMTHHTPGGASACVCACICLCVYVHVRMCLEAVWSSHLLGMAKRLAASHCRALAC